MLCPKVSCLQVIVRVFAHRNGFASRLTGLGLGMVVGGAILKIPQIIKIVSTRSTRGLSLSAFVSKCSFLQYT